jgi:hypothetical protein
MRDDLNIDLIFPIRDDVSAGLMCVKAELLYDAGVISAKELNVVIGRAAAVVDQAGKRARRWPTEPSADRGRSDRSGRAIEPRPAAGSHH